VVGSGGHGYPGNGMKGRNDLKAAFAKDIVVEKRDGGRRMEESERGDKSLYETVRIRGG